MTNDTVRPPDQPTDTLGYAEAVAELDAILDRLEHDEPDVDRIAIDVARAGELVRHCRERITLARTKVQEVTAGLDPAGDDTEPDDSPES